MHHGHVSHAMTQHRQTRLSRVPGCSPSLPSLALVSPHQPAAGDLPACPSRLSPLISCLQLSPYQLPSVGAATACSHGTRKQSRKAQCREGFPSSPLNRPCQSTGKGQGRDRTSALRGQVRDRNRAEHKAPRRLQAGGTEKKGWEVLPVQKGSKLGKEVALQHEPIKCHLSYGKPL